MNKVKPLETTSEIMSQIMAGYLCNGCKGCPFYGIEKYEIAQYCDSTPIDCKWMILWNYFRNVEKKEAEDE